MNRRQLLAALTTAGFLPPLSANARLNRLTEAGTLPFAPALQGISPLPARNPYNARARQTVRELDRG